MAVKTIVCLATSRKSGGRCIAGKELTSAKWVRPVSGRDTEEISEEEQKYEDGSLPKLLDILKIPIKIHKPNLFQTENYLIDDNVFWEKAGEFSGRLDDLLDYPENLWGIGSSSYQGLNDRFSETHYNNYTESLYLIKPQSLKIIVRIEGEESDNPKRKVRARFKYKQQEYLWPITDPDVERQYLCGDDGEFQLEATQYYLCVSVGLPYKGYCYKFVASIIRGRQK